MLNYIVNCPDGIKNVIGNDLSLVTWIAVNAEKVYLVSIKLYKGYLDLTHKASCDFLMDKNKIMDNTLVPLKRSMTTP